MTRVALVLPYRAEATIFNSPQVEEDFLYGRSKARACTPPNSPFFHGSTIPASSWRTASPARSEYAARAARLAALRRPAPSAAEPSRVGAISDAPRRSRWIAFTPCVLSVTREHLSPVRYEGTSSSRHPSTRRGPRGGVRSTCTAVYSRRRAGTPHVS